jgi:hypothetical protein
MGWSSRSRVLPVLQPYIFGPFDELYRGDQTDGKVYNSRQKETRNNTNMQSGS